MTTKILALTDALGNLVRFVLLPGQRFDTVGVPPLIEGLAFDALIADKAFDSNAIIADLDERGSKVVISQHPRRAKPLAIDEEMYKWRHLIENFFCKLKEFKRIAMRAEKTDLSFEAMINLAAAEGHPASVMDMSFANQSLASEYLVKNHAQLKNQVYSVPDVIDRQIAKLNLESMGVTLDKLTPDQEQYLASWDEGT